MVYTKWWLDWTPFKNGTWSSADTITLDSFHSPLMQLGLGETRDAFQFVVTNFNGNFDNYFNPNDKVAIYRAVNSDSKPADPLMIITLKDTPEVYNSIDNSIKVEGYNYSESVLGAIVFVDVTNATIPEAIEAALDDAGQDNPNFKVTWDSGNPSVKTSGGSFPVIGKKWFYKPIRQLIEEYSSNAKTEDGYYYWYVNNQNKLVWKQQDQFGTGTFDDTTDAYREMKVGKDIKGIKNYFILKGGMDPEGHQIMQPYINWNSVASNGRKFLIVTSEQNTAKELIDQDFTKSYSAEDKQALTARYPAEIEAGTSFTTAWTAFATYTTTKYGIPVTKGATVIINEGGAASNKEAYVEVIRKEVKERLKSRGAEIADTLQYGRLNVDLEFAPGTKTWGLGDNITCNIGTIEDGDDKVMRVKEIQISTNSDMYSLEEEISQTVKY